MRTYDELMKLTKVQLEEYGRTLGVEEEVIIDRRKKKESLVGLLIDVQELCKPKKEEESLADTIEDVIEEIEGKVKDFLLGLKKTIFVMLSSGIIHEKRQRKENKCQLGVLKKKALRMQVVPIQKTS